MGLVAIYLFFFFGLIHDVHLVLTYVLEIRELFSYISQMVDMYVLSYQNPPIVKEYQIVHLYTQIFSFFQLVIINFLLILYFLTNCEIQDC